ncbi:MAG: ATP-dependent helicase [Actinomycetia bacterium]|nr:ATP-dependent helicase [Actinomycetes bacterium]
MTLVSSDVFDQHMTFVAADPPHTSWFACWDPHERGGLLDSADPIDEHVDIEVVVPTSRGTRRAVVSAQQLTMTDAIDALAQLRHSDSASASAHVWAAVVRAALALVAAGKVLPWVSPAGYDTWRVDPLAQSDIDHLGVLSAALPAEAHARPVDTAAGTTGLIADPTYTIRAVFDAVADRLIRTAAAPDVGSMSMFAQLQPTKVPHLRPWVNDVAVAHCASARLVLRVSPPDDEPPADGLADWQVTFQLQSRTDPSLLVDAADFWQTPAEVAQRLGEQAEVILLEGLRRVGNLCPRFASVLDRATPTSIDLDDDDIDNLLDHLEELTTAGIDLRWPSEMVTPNVERRLVVGASAPGGSLRSVTDLESLLNVDWEFLIEGVALTVAELKVLGAAKRAIVPLRGKWVRLDAATRRRLQERPPTITTNMALAAALGAELTLDGDSEPTPVRVAGVVEDLIERLANLSGEREQAEPIGLHAVLRPYQRRGLAWMSDLCSLGLGGCLADDMGLGKTVQLLALHAMRTGPTLVVCPTSLVGNWCREAARFLPDVTVHTFHGATRSLAGIGSGDIVITTYGVVRSDADALDTIDWDLVVADEAQAAKNPRSRTAKALRQIGSTARIALTGTPVENRLSELWSILDWAVPGLLGPLETFRRQTAAPIERDGDREATRRLARLIGPFLLRRKKTDPGIAPELPPKIERDLTVVLSPEQATLYKATVDVALHEVAEASGIERRGLVLKLLTGLKQITNHPAQFLKESGPLEHRSGKLEALDELLASTTSNGEATLVFTQYVQMGRLITSFLSERSHRVEILHGSMTIAARQSLVDRFQAGEIDVLILSLRAGGTGLNLTAATSVVHYDRWWNPAVEDQATDRAYRIGQDKTVTVYRIITEGTVEDRVAELLRLKRQLADRVVGTGEGWIGDLSDAELGELVSLDTT